MLKKDLRRQLLQKRAAYSPAELAAKSKAIAAQFFNHFNLADIQAVHLFLPIQRRHELDTWPIIRQLQAEYPQVQVVASVADTREFTLTHHWLLPETQLVENKWGIPEPQNAALIPIEKLDLVLVPLLAFDAKGYRVGYGKGFYDRFLSACRPETLKVGLSLEPAVPEITDVHADDVRLDAVITPEGVVRFS
jgi:5-formyltetrahydrofolate cyclo-ligase